MNFRRPGSVRRVGPQPVGHRENGLRAFPAFQVLALVGHYTRAVLAVLADPPGGIQVVSLTFLVSQYPGIVQAEIAKLHTGAVGRLAGRLRDKPYRQ